MSMLIRSIVAIPLLLILALVAWLLGALIDPFAAAVLAEVDNGFGEAGETAIRIGIRYTLPGLGVAVIAWWIFGTLVQDERRGVQRRGFQRRGRR
jgi:uncharacterized membrane protein